MRNVSFFPTEPLDLISENLRESLLRQQLACEQALYHVREYAQEIAAIAETDEEIAELLQKRKDLLSDSSLLTGFPSGSRPLLDRHLRENSLFLRMVFFRELGLIRSRRTSNYYPETEMIADATPAKAAGRISYQKNHYSDRAYLLFADSGITQTPKASYRNHFSEICEDVYNGNAEFGILPTGNSSEGQLPRFLSYLEKYELKIRAICSVASDDSGITNDFALLAKTQETYPAHKGAEAYLQYSIVPERQETLRELLFAAEFCSLYPIRLDSLPVRDGASLSYYPVFQMCGADLTTFYTYLSIDLPQAVPIGVYQRIMENQK